MLKSDFDRIRREINATTSIVGFSLLIIFALLGGFCWPYTLNSWLVFAGKVAVVKFWHGALLGICPLIGQLSIPAAAITFIVMLFLL